MKILFYRDGVAFTRSLGNLTRLNFNESNEIFGGSLINLVPERNFSEEE